MKYTTEFRPVVFCLSERENLLNQWRDYGRDVVPYCIAFNSAGLLLNDRSFPSQLVKLIYKLEAQKEILRNLLKSMLSKTKRVLPLIKLPEEEEVLVKTLAEEIWTVLIRFKNPAFEAEEEWRLLTYGAWLGGQPVQFRPSTLGILPFFARKPRFGTLLPISKVWVGPSPFGKVSEQALQVFLRQYGYNNCETEASEIPAR